MVSSLLAPQLFLYLGDLLCGEHGILVDLDLRAGKASYLAVLFCEVPASSSCQLDPKLFGSTLGCTDDRRISILYQG